MIGPISPDRAALASERNISLARSAPLAIERAASTADAAPFGRLPQRPRRPARSADRRLFGVPAQLDVSLPPSWLEEAE